MKFPRQNLLCFIAFLAFSSCEKEAVAITESEPTQDIDLRCCDDAVSNMLEDPRFNDFYEAFTNEVYDPTTTLFNQIDEDELSTELAAFEECINSGASFDYCLSQSPILIRLVSIVNDFDKDKLIVLQAEFDYLNKDEFNLVLFEAIEQVSRESGLRLDCFLQFRVEMIETIAAGIIASISSGGAGVVAVFAGMIRAKVNYCNCLYSNYGTHC